MKKFTSFCLMFMVVVAAVFFGNYLTNKSSAPTKAVPQPSFTTDGSEMIPLGLVHIPANLEGSSFFLTILPEEEDATPLHLAYDLGKMMPKIENHGAQVVFSSNDGEDELNLFRTRDAGTKKLAWVLLRYKPQLEVVSTDADQKLIQVELDKLAGK